MGCIGVRFPVVVGCSLCRRLPVLCPPGPQTKHNVVVKWSTLSKYFEDAMAHGTAEYPVVRGSFFPYSDRQLDYWTGYFNSRIFYKGVDRQLEGCVGVRVRERVRVCVRARGVPALVRVRATYLPCGLSLARGDW
jgi:hypothetical protein